MGVMVYPSPERLVTYESLAALRDAGPPVVTATSDFVLAVILGYAADGDGGGGDFIWFPAGLPDGQTDDDCCIIIPPGSTAGSGWVRQFSGPIDVRWAGAVEGSYTAPNYTSFLNAYAASQNGFLGAPSRLYFPAGDWFTNNPVNTAFDFANCDLVGALSQGVDGGTAYPVSLLRFTGAGSATLQCARLLNITIDGNAGNLTACTTGSVIDASITEMAFGITVGPCVERSYLVNLSGLTISPASSSLGAVIRQSEIGMVGSGYFISCQAPSLLIDNVTFNNSITIESSGTDCSDLVMQNLVPGSLVPAVSGIAHVSPSVEAVTPASGTVYQNEALFPVTVRVPVTFSPTTTAAATLAVALGPTSTPPTVTTDSEPAGLLAGSVRSIEFKVPAGFYYSLTAAAATIGTGVIIS